MPEEARAAPVEPTPEPIHPGLPVFVGVALALCYWQYLAWMLERWWKDEYYGHGIMVPIVSGYIIYRHWDKITSLPRERFRFGLPLTALGLALHAWATYVDVNFPSGFALIITAFGCVIWLWGWPVAKAIAFPIAYMAFAVPIARLLVDQFAQPLQLFSAKFGASFASAIGVPTTREGTAISIPEYTFEVAIVCSGLKSVIAMSALGALFAYMVEAPMWKRLVLFAASVPVALFANGSRIALTLVLGRIFGPKAAEGFFHTVSGLVVFLLALIGLFIVGSVLRCGKMREDI